MNGKKARKEKYGKGREDDTCFARHVAMCLLSGLFVCLQINVKRKNRKEARLQWEVCSCIDLQKKSCLGFQAKELIQKKKKSVRSRFKIDGS